MSDPGWHGWGREEGGPLAKKRGEDEGRGKKGKGKGVNKSFHIKFDCTLLTVVTEAKWSQNFNGMSKIEPKFQWHIHPDSICGGKLHTFSDDTNKIFRFFNGGQSEAFTLNPLTCAVIARV